MKINSNETKLHCEVDSENELQIIYLGDRPSRRSRMLCV